ncbi:unnamed protein product [Didymodactylos carnosus]|uniref:Uncharacterized protein n=1 Tax=Didymodactylos carnosus TaxID=1234261 RepID=A0A815CE04_9BILA|nr:unnamed protein product [Didymodactylos carnosus]CAF1282308.1 unnamed protein product [Didymodactylos carnosus]CAF3530702.1 unnamed protein product [Didymodactylos carnosus]CAF4078542.1 unnamed protein product [Didymodactylos carnosus]
MVASLLVCKRARRARCGQTIRTKQSLRLLDIPDKNGHYPLMHACVKLDAEYILLNHGAKVDATTETGRTALMVAAGCGFKKACVLLVDAGANVNTRDNKCSVLHKAIDSNNVDTVVYLLQKGAKATEPDNQNWTPLFRAVSVNCHPDIIKSLIDHGADVNVTDKEGTSALAMSVIHGNLASAQHLIRAGADIHTTTKHGKTLLQLASASGRNVS